MLLTCDAVRNRATVDRFFSPETGAQFTALGLVRPSNIPSSWLGACEPDPSDFRRLLALEFRLFISAHGEEAAAEGLACEMLEQRFPRSRNELSVTCPLDL